MDLVDAEDSEVLRQHPSYHETLVENNLLIRPPGGDSARLLHFGGDSGNVPTYRKRLIFRDNTVLTGIKGNTTIFQADTNDQHIDVTNNLFYQLDNLGIESRWYIAGRMGRIDLEDNKVKGRWYNNAPGVYRKEEPRIRGQETFIRVTEANWHPRTSPCEHHDH